MIRGALGPRIPFWDFVTSICHIGDPDTKVQLTTAQRAIWKSYDRRVALDPDEGDAYHELAGKEPWRLGDKAPPFLLMTLTRGGGKSLLLATIAVYEAITNSYEAAPGETVAVVALAPRKKQVKDMLGYARAHFEQPGLAPFLLKAPEEMILLQNNRSIRVQAVDTSGGAARGPTYICSLFDESAYLGYEGKIVDADQWKAIIAGARGVEDFHGVLSSTPNGEQGFFFETFDENWGHSDTSWEVFHGPQPLTRPEMPPELLQEYRRADEEAFRREFLCDFKAGMGVEKFFDPDQVKACVVSGLMECPPRGPAIQYRCAVDPTGGSHDWMTMTIVERVEDGRVRQCVTKGWDPKADSTATVHEIAREIAEMVAPYGITTVYGDIFGGQWVAEAFAAVGIEYETRGYNNTQKLQRASLLRELFAAQRIELLDVPRQTREICEYEKKTLPSGAISVNHPLTRTGSDDYLDSLALATWELVGNDTRLHPPETMERWDPKKWKKELFAGATYPDISPEASDTAAKIMAKGEGPAWTLQNWSRDWRYCQCSLGELSWLCGVGPIQLAQVLGRDMVLQLCWARWILAHFRLDPDVILQAHFIALPGFEEVKTRIRAAGETTWIVTYDSVGADAWCRGSLPGDWQPLAVKSKDPERGVSLAPAFPPWQRPPEEWNLRHDVEEFYDGWPDRPWIGIITNAFGRRRRTSTLRLEEHGEHISQNIW